MNTFRFRLAAGFNKVRALVRMRGAYKTPEEREVAEALRKAEEAAQQAKLAEEARQAKEKETEEQREAERLQREKDKAVAKRAKAAADAMNLRKALELEEWKEQRRQRLKPGRGERGGGWRSQRRLYTCRISVRSQCESGVNV